MFPRRLRPGQQYTATELSEMARTVAALDTASGVGGITLSREGGGFVVRDDSTPPIFGKITGAPTGAKYPWSQVYANEDGTFSTVATEYGIAGTAASVPAVELGGRTDVAVNSIVVLFPLASGAGYGFSAGAADPTIKTLSVVTRVCPTLTVTKDGGGFVTDVSLSLSVERRTIHLPSGVTFDDPVCSTNQTNCCGDVTTSCCDTDVPASLFLTISDGGGSYPMEWDGATYWDTGYIEVPGCGTARFRMDCFDIAGTKYWRLGPELSASVDCADDASTLTVASCAGGLTSTSFTITFTDGSGTSCGCVGSTRTITVTP